MVEQFEFVLERRLPSLERVELFLDALQFFKGFVLLGLHLQQLLLLGVHGQLALLVVDPQLVDLLGEDVLFSLRRVGSGLRLCRSFETDVLVDVGVERVR